MKYDIRLYRAFSEWMKTCDLIEWRSYTSPISFMIRMFTGANVNHSSILIRPIMYAGLKDRRFLLEALAKGVVPRLLSLRLEEYNGQVFWSPLKESITDPQRNKMIEQVFLEVSKGRPYDYGNLFRNIAGRVSVDADAWFCSEIYTWMLMKGGLISADTKALRPGEFQELGLHEKPVLIHDSKLDWGANDENN